MVIWCQIGEQGTSSTLTLENTLMANPVHYAHCVLCALWPDTQSGRHRQFFRRPACVRSLLVEIDVHILEQASVRGGDKVLNAGAKAVYGARIDQI